LRLSKRSPANQQASCYQEQSAREGEHIGLKSVFCVAIRINQEAVHHTLNIQLLVVVGKWRYRKLARNGLLIVDPGTKY
jgi:hypothetical protein